MQLSVGPRALGFVNGDRIPVYRDLRICFLSPWANEVLHCTVSGEQNLRRNSRIVLALGLHRSQIGHRKRNLFKWCQVSDLTPSKPRDLGVLK